MAEEQLHEWQVPPQASPDIRKLNWLNEQAEDGQAWLRSQRGYGDWKKAFDVLANRPERAQIPAYRSQLSTGRLKRNVKEVIGASANIRPIWAYNSDNPAFQKEATMMNKTIRAIYLENFLDLGIKQTLQWSATTGTGWLRPLYRRNLYGTGKGNLCFYAYGAASVLPTQLPTNNDWQEAYAVTLLDELPVAMAHGMFPKFQDVLTPTKSQFWYSNEIRRTTKGNLFQRMWNSWRRSENSLLADLYVPIRYTWVLDLAVNTGDVPLHMGDWGVDNNKNPYPLNSWSYEVPHVGQDIQVGESRGGQKLYRKANENDARVYPYRRLLISSERVILYDGPAFDWHGQLPLVNFQLDDWAWEALGFSLVRDGYNLQQAMDEIDRGTMDKVRAGLDMALAYDINSVTKKEADMFDPMQPRARVGFDGSLVEKPFQQVVPDVVLKLDPNASVFRKDMQDQMDYQLAINDITSLAKARAMGGDADNLEKVMQADGPIVRDISRNVERGLARVGDQSKYIVLQWYNSRRVMQYVGANQISQNVLDYDPDSLVPSHLPDEFVRSTNKKVKGMVRPDAASQYSKAVRARWFADNLRFFLLPHSVHEIAQMSYKLGLIQLRKAGVQIDSQTIAEAWNLDLGANFQGNTPWERFFEEQEAMAEHAIRVKFIVDAIQAAGVQPTPAMVSAIQAMQGGGNGTGVGSNPEGRPSTYREAPQLVSKEGGARSTISTSGS